MKYNVKRARVLFEARKDLDKLYLLSNGEVFFEEQKALNFANTLRRKGVTGVTVKVVERGKVDEFVKTLPQDNKVDATALQAEVVKLRKELDEANELTEAYAKELEELKQAKEPKDTKETKETKK